jgi:hypothetical protein
MAKQSLGDFLRNLGGVIDEVDRAGAFDFINARGAPVDDRWWELFDLDVEPQTRAALELAWKVWRVSNHPDRGLCSDARFKHMSALYDRKRADLPEDAATG